jgi:hypothetical protein
MAELLLQKTAMHDQCVGVDPHHRIKDLVHRGAQQIQLIDQQHQRGLAILDGPRVGPLAWQSGVRADRFRQVVGSRCHDRVSIRAAESEVAEPGHGFAHGLGNTADSGLNRGRHRATIDHVLYLIQCTHDVGLGRSGRCWWWRWGWLRTPPGNGCDPVLEPHEMQTMIESWIRTSAVHRGWRHPRGLVRLRPTGDLADAPDRGTRET